MLRRAFWWVLLLLLLTVVIQFTPSEYQFTTQSELVNRLFAIIQCALLPILLLIAAFKIRWIAIKVIGVIAAGTLLLLSIPIVCLQLIGLPDIIETGHSAGFRYLSSIEIERGELVLYLSDCGATCDFVLVVKKERELPLGFKLVKNIWRLQGFNQAKFQRLKDQVQLDADGDVIATFKPPYDKADPAAL